MRLILIRMARFSRSALWRDTSTVTDSASRAVLPQVLLLGAIAAIICYIERATDPEFTLGIGVTTYEVGGAVLGLLLVLRTNEGLGRWWEGRKLWGGIVNQCRNLAVDALAYGPADEGWRRDVVRWTIAFAHASRRSLRGERTLPEIAALVGEAGAARLAEAEHMPGHVALVLARLLRTAVDRLGMDRFAFLQLDKERAALIDHIGGCERIRGTPLPKAYSVQIHRFLFVFLFLLPFGLISKYTLYSIKVWYVPPITMLVAFPLLSLDLIGSQLQAPFSVRSLNHLDLDGITSKIEQNLLALLDSPAVAGEEAGVVVEIDAPGPSATSPA